MCPTTVRCPRAAFGPTSLRAAQDTSRMSSASSSRSTPSSPAVLVRTTTAATAAARRASGASQGGEARSVSALSTPSPEGIGWERSARASTSGRTPRARLRLGTSRTESSVRTKGNHIKQWSERVSDFSVTYVRTTHSNNVRDPLWTRKDPIAPRRVDCYGAVRAVSLGRRSSRRHDGRRRARRDPRARRRRSRPPPATRPAGRTSRARPQPCP